MTETCSRLFTQLLAYWPNNSHAASKVGIVGMHLVFMYLRGFVMWRSVSSCDRIFSKLQSKVVGVYNSADDVEVVPCMYIILL